MKTLFSFLLSVLIATVFTGCCPCGDKPEKAPSPEQETQ